jgi:hypothetical protein
MLANYFWIILAVLDVLCAFVASIFILWLANSEEKRLRKAVPAKMTIESKEKALRTEVDSLREEAKSLRELLRDEQK